MATRLEILEQSLIKKKEKYNQRLNRHFADVKAANGQPLNDKRNGTATMSRWEKQRSSLKSLEESIEKTELAIAKEQHKLDVIDFVNRDLPPAISKAIEAGEIAQWKKHPHIFFVAGVKEARISWDKNKNILSHSYTDKITDKQEWRVFAKMYNSLSKIINK